MYRELGSLDAFGVPGGPYTGAPRTFPWHRLPEPVMLRLSRCLAGEELPAPLLRASLGRSRRARQLAIATALVVLPWLGSWMTPTGFIPPWPLGIVFVALFALAGRLVQQASRRDKLQSGVYLFPLDVVEASRDTVRVSPFGSLKNAGIRRDGSSITLELGFDHGARYSFACADEAAAERAYAKIKEAHAAVERVTYGRDLEETVDLDPFFALRGEQPWADAVQLRPEGIAAREAIGVLAGMFTGLIAFVACIVHMDNELYQFAYSGNTEASYAAYLESGGRVHRSSAEQQIRLLRERAAAKSRAAAEEHELTAVDWRHQPDIALSAAASQLRRTQQEQALNRYALVVAAPPQGPASRWAEPLHFGAHLQRIFQAARDRGDDRLYFRFQRTGLDSASASVVESLDARERRLVSAFARVLSDTVPANLLVVSRAAGDPPNPEHELTLQVHETLVLRSPSDLDVTFDVTPIARGEALPHGFQLRMPAPSKKLDRVRARSLFEVQAAPEDRHAVDLVTARAFDRLYDELYGLFFPGDPKVPIALEDAPRAP